MKVLVIGGCGFLGSHVCEVFKKMGWYVVAYDNLTKFEYSRVPYFDIEKVRNYNLLFLEGRGIPTIIEDIRNPKMLMKTASNCDLICNCAAQPAMTIAMEDPRLDLGVNVLGSLNVLECARQSNLPVINCSTIHVYGNEINEELEELPDRFYREPPTINEVHPLLTGMVSPLHASKRTMELYTQAYIDTYGVKAAVFRLTGIYGPRQFGSEDHGWVANFAIRTMLGLPIKVFGTDKQVRDILYVQDAARAFYDWFEAKCPPGIYNIGGGEKYITSLRYCLDLLRSITKRRQRILLEPSRRGDLYYFCCDFSKARETFGWKPQIPPQEGIPRLVNWIIENKEVFK